MFQVETEKLRPGGVTSEASSCNVALGLQYLPRGLTKKRLKYSFIFNSFSYCPILTQVGVNQHLKKKATPMIEFQPTQRRLEVLVYSLLSSDIFPFPCDWKEKEESK